MKRRAYPSGDKNILAFVEFEAMVCQDPGIESGVVLRRYLVGSVIALFGCGTPVAVCGDGVVSSGEACDDGNNANNDGCRADCFGTERCGDFLLDEGESCDDGNNDDGDGCTSDCSRREICGDNILDAGEECDDGNNTNADGCEADCRNPACQNGVIDPGERCTGFANDSKVDALPFAVKLADVNNDGFVDLISSNAGRAVIHTPPVLEGTVSVLFGEGNGKFTGRINYSVHREPIALSVQDLNGDNFADIVAINADSNAMSVLLNTGDGFFAPEQEYETGDQPSSVVAFDRDGDNDLDLAITETLDEQVSIFINQGQDFIFSESIPVTGFPRSVTSQDFDQDGLLDLAVARLNEQKISVLLQRNNTWEERELVAEGFPIDIKSGDIDDDTSVDLIVSYASASEVGIYFGDGSGNFPPEQRLATGDNPSELALEDLNNDGLLDVVVFNKGDNDASALINEGSRAFSPERRIEDLVLFAAFALGDINSDGRVDVSMAVNLSSFARTFFGDGDGGFRTSPSFVIPDVSLQSAIVDLDGDSLLDVAALSAQNISLFLNRGENKLVHEVDLPASNVAGLTAYQGASHRLAAVTSDGFLSLLDISAQPQQLDIGGAPAKVVAGDLLGESEQELLIFDAASNELRVFVQENNTLAEQPPITVGEAVSGVSLHDIDGDGHQDIIARTAGAVRFFFGDSAGLFVEQSIPLTATPTAHLFLDGVLYVVSPGSITVITQTQPRQLEVQENLIPGDWRAITSSDVNVDNAQELILSDFSNNEVVALSASDLSVIQRFTVAAPSEVLAEDMNDDTLPDVFVVETLQNRFRIFFSNP
jgi:cysteine-rich repeat protein